MTAKKQVCGSGEGCQCADHLHGVWAYCSSNFSAMKATVLFDGRNLDELRDIKSHGIEYHNIGRVEVDLNQRKFSR